MSEEHDETVGMVICSKASRCVAHQVIPCSHGVAHVRFGKSCEIDNHLCSACVPCSDHPDANPQQEITAHDIPAPTPTLRDFRSLLCKYGIVHRDAVEDPEGWDGGCTYQNITEAYEELFEVRTTKQSISNK